jgi:hypothetical protein
MAATQENNLLGLAKLLSGAVNECLTEGQMPHMDPAVRLICFQIAFAGNGDLSAPGYFEEVYHYCQTKALHSPNIDIPQENKDVKPPVHKAS